MNFVSVVRSECKLLQISDQYVSKYAASRDYDAHIILIMSHDKLHHQAIEHF